MSGGGGRRARLLVVAAGPGLALVLGGCESSQSTLKPASDAARGIDSLWWWTMGGAWIGLSVIVFLIWLGWWRRSRPGLPFGGGERAATAMIVVLGIVVPILALTALFAYSDFFLIRKTSAPAVGSTAMTIHIIGHQWFWEVRYPGTTAVTANEIHIPVGTRVNVVATTVDVVHSFWVPALNRKIDTIPGHENRILLEADRPGYFRGQCTEYCGLQHANMGLAVYAQPPAEFREWLANMARPARAPVTPDERRGREVFLSQACAACHTIRGTPASGTVGPDLTHLQTRRTLAGLAIPNTRGYLAGWILDPQDVKPGAKMPGLGLEGPDFQALLAYLESLS